MTNEQYEFLDSYRGIVREIPRDIPNAFSRWIFPADGKVFLVFQLPIISNDWYVETEEEAVTIQNLHRDRYYKHSIITSDSITSEATKDIAVKYLKRKLGYQRVSRDKIGINKNYSRDGHHTAYYINYNGHCYRVM